MDIIVTTPKSEMLGAALEAADCIAAGGGQYFRRFAIRARPRIDPGERVYYVEDRCVRGFALVSRTFASGGEGLTCDSTGRRWPPGFYVFMDSRTWQWIDPIPMRGFQGFRYAYLWLDDGRSISAIPQGYPRVKIVGGWRDPRPACGG